MRRDREGRKQPEGGTVGYLKRADNCCRYSVRASALLNSITFNVPAVLSLLSVASVAACGRLGLCLVFWTRKRQG